MGSFDGRVHAKEEADTHGNGDGEQDRPQRNGRRQAGNSEIDQQADHAAEQHTDHAPSSGEHDGFGKELPDDVAATRTDGFADTNLAGALSDGHEHDVHHADAADEKADGADNGNEKSYGSGDLAKLIGDLLRARNAEIIRLVVGHTSATAQH